jgi:prevent-host-death family protein
MQSVGIKTLKNNLSAYVRAAAAGDTVQVTDRGRIVAELVPPRAAHVAPDATEAERQMAELIRRGLVTPAKIPPEARLPPRQSSLISLEELMRDLDDSRSDR